MRYYGAYSNATRGKRKKAAASAEPSSSDRRPTIQRYRTDRTAPPSGAGERN